MAVDPKANVVSGKEEVMPDTSQISLFDSTFGMLGFPGDCRTHWARVMDTAVQEFLLMAEEILSLAFEDDDVLILLISDTVQVYFRKKIDLEGNAGRWYYLYYCR